MLGVDVSHWDKDDKKHPINYADICRLFDFIIIKATDGANKDPEYMTAYNSTLRLKQGFYAYTYATTEAAARREARAFCGAINGCKAEMGCYIDVEDKTLKKLSKKAVTAIVNAWILEAKKLGVDMGIYTNRNWIKNHLYLEGLVCERLWLAEYTDSIEKLIALRETYQPDIIQYGKYKMPNGRKADANIIF